MLNPLDNDPTRFAPRSEKATFGRRGDGPGVSGRIPVRHALAATPTGQPRRVPTIAYVMHAGVCGAPSRPWTRPNETDLPVPFPSTVFSRPGRAVHRGSSRHDPGVWGVSRREQSLRMEEEHGLPPELRHADAHRAVVRLSPVVVDRRKRPASR
jgi:hypothetical protein